MQQKKTIMEYQPLITGEVDLDILVSGIKELMQDLPDIDVSSTQEDPVRKSIDNSAPSV
jgi:hypothetical protein